MVCSNVENRPEGLQYGSGVGLVINYMRKKPFVSTVE